MKKIFNFTLLVTLLAATMVGCKPNTDVERVYHLQKVEDYLWEATVDDYYDTIPQHLVDELEMIFGCSAVRNGNYFGRNLDLFVSELSEVVVHTPAHRGYYATVGIARADFMTDEDLAKGLSEEDFRTLPLAMYDGINEKGLFCNMNLVDYADGGDNPGTNPGKPDLHIAFMVRQLLDNCATVEEAIEYVNNHNIIGGKMGEFNMHYMIGDPNKTVILEFVDNKAVWITDQQQPMIMTNFYNSGLPNYNDQAEGIERYEILKEHYDEGAESVDGMYNLMHRVRYSLAYDTTAVPFWKSEYIDLGKSGYFFSKEELLACPTVKEQIEHFAHYRETGEYELEWGLWFTEHVSIYDIAKRELTVTVHEHYDNPMHRHVFRIN